MRDGTCPKCNSVTVHVKRKGISFGERGVYVLTAEWVSKPLPLDHYICTTCGYFESYVVDKTKLEAVAREWTKVSGLESQEKSARETETLTIETHPARSDVDFLDDQINAYNLATTGIPFGGLLACFVRDEAGQIVAGIYGWTWGDCCEIKSLWVHADWRRQRYGTRLLQVAEQEAARRGCAQMVLSTHSFQAPEFYRKRGYEVVGSVEGYPREHQSIYLRKSLELLAH